MSPSLHGRLLLPLAGIVLSGAVFTFATREHSEVRMIDALLAAVGIVLVWSAALAVRLRDPDRPLNRLLFVLAGVYALQVLVTSSSPWLYTIGRASRPLIEAMLLWVMLAFPSGRLDSRGPRLVIGVAMLVVPALWILGMATSSDIPMGGRFVTCGAECPRNLLQIADAPMISQGAYAAFRVVGIVVEVSAAALLARRLLRATPLMRRTLAPVLFAAIARTLSVALFLISGKGPLLLTLTFWLVPAAIVFGQLRGRWFMAGALQDMVSGLSTQPDAAGLRASMARALGDPTLQLVYWSQERRGWIDEAGSAVELDAVVADAERAVTVVRSEEGRSVAALLHDAAICDEPRLPEAVAQSMRVALESLRTRAELSRSKHAALTAADSERQRIERDLHDGAQQRLIALRMKLSVALRLMDHDARRARALMAELDGDVAAALAELRALAHGVVLPLLDAQGLPAALRDLAARAAIDTYAEIEDIGRCDPAVENALYFCCAEALQNAAKHAGFAATATLSLWQDADALNASVEDDGPGLVGTEEPQIGKGFGNLRARMDAVGGSLSIAPGANGGFALSFRVPCAAQAPQS